MPLLAPARVRLAASFLAFAALAAAVGACGDNQDDAGARDLWDRIHAADFRGWRRAPNYPARRASHTSHADAVEIVVNPALSAALDEGRPLAAWPEGAIVVKEGFSEGGDRKLVAVMEKRADGWFWAEYDDEGNADFSGRPSVCLDCHGSRKDAADWVFAFDLPR